MLPPLALEGLAAVGGVAGVIALLGAIIGFGRTLQVLSEVKEKTATIPTLVADVAYIKGRLDGRQEGLAEVLPVRAPRRSRPKIVSG